MQRIFTTILVIAAFTLGYWLAQRPWAPDFEKVVDAGRQWVETKPQSSQPPQTAQAAQAAPEAKTDTDRQLARAEELIKPIRALMDSMGPAPQPDQASSKDSRIRK